MSAVWADESAHGSGLLPGASSAPLANTHSGSSEASPAVKAAAKKGKTAWRARAATIAHPRRAQGGTPPVYGSALEMEAVAEKVGWLWKQGQLSVSSFKKRWCLLVPPPTPDGAGLDTDSHDRWLVYYDEKTAAEPNGAMHLCLGGYEVEPTAPKTDRDHTFRIMITDGASKGASYTMAADTADGLFSWMESLQVRHKQPAVGEVYHYIPALDWSSLTDCLR